MLNNVAARPHRREVSGGLPDGARVYVTAPKSEYQSSRYRHLVTLLRERVPHASIVEARTAFRDLADWQANRPKVLAATSALVFVTTRDAWIGRGVWADIRDARARIPVFLLTEHGQLVPYECLSFSRPNADDWTRHVRVYAPPGT